MKFRLTLFFIFQALAWITYFSWETDANIMDSLDKTEKIVQVQEMSTHQLASDNVQNRLYRLILRNDGFFIRVNEDESTDNGLWLVDHTIPSLTLKFPSGNKIYRILKDSNKSLQLELMNTEDKIQAKINEEKELKLFSSIE